MNEPLRFSNVSASAISDALEGCPFLWRAYMPLSLLFVYSKCYELDRSLLLHTAS